MRSSSPLHWLSISMGVGFMSLSAIPSTAKGRGMAILFIVTWTPAMPSPPATFASMQRFASERRRWPVLIKPEMSMLLTRRWKIGKTGQLQRPLNVLPSQSDLQSSPAHNDWVSVRFYSMLLLTDLTGDDRAEIVCWVTESKWPFQIVNDCGFQSLMKTGRPEYHIP